MYQFLTSSKFRFEVEPHGFCNEYEETLEHMFYVFPVTRKTLDLRGMSHTKNFLVFFVLLFLECCGDTFQLTLRNIFASKLLTTRK